MKQALHHHAANLGDGNVEVEFKGENGSSEQYNEYHKGSILKLCQLHLQRTKLHPPADSGVRGRGLEPHTLPVGGLNVLHVEQHKKNQSLN